MGGCGCGCGWPPIRVRKVESRKGKKASRQPANATNYLSCMWRAPSFAPALKKK